MDRIGKSFRGPVNSSLEPSDLSVFQKLKTNNNHSPKTYHLGFASWDLTYNTLTGRGEMVEKNLRKEDLIN